MEHGKATTTSAGDGIDRRKRGNRRKTVSGATPSVQDEVKTRLRASSDVMRFPWSSSPSASTPASPAIPVNANSTAPATTSAATRGAGHKRALSGNILSKLNFLRGSSGEDARPAAARERGEKDQGGTSPTKSLFSRKGAEDEGEKDDKESASGDAGKLFSRKSVDDDVPLTSPTSPDGERERESALIAAMRQVKTRKRRGSLRKTALLGGRRILPEGRERKGSFGLLQRPPSMKQVDEARPQEHDAIVDDLHDRSFAHEQQTTHPLPLSARRNFNYENSLASTASSSDVSFLEPPAATMARLSLLTDRQNPISATATATATTTTTTTTAGGIRTIANDLGSPTEIKSPTSETTNYTSTTSEDDLLTFAPHRPSSKTFPASSTSASQPNLTPLSTISSTNTGSYFPPVSLSRPSTTSSSLAQRTTSPLSRSLPLSASAYPDIKSKPEPHSYTETEYWGWIILTFTWITFTVGMGSCLEIWSWAWDVGETPYAPPELENDETLPIVGYYPALIVLTGGVVSWVWITVAWVGMKYFRHAKIDV